VTGCRWRGRSIALLLLLSPWGLRGQSVLLDGPSSYTLPAITPAFQFRAQGVGAQLPLQVTVQVTTTPDFSSLLVDSTFTTSDTVFTLQIARALPSEALVYWRARVRTADGVLLTSPALGPRQIPTWLQLITPNSITGNSFDTRRPLLVWRSAPVAAATGPWRYDVEITSGGRSEIAVSGLTDTLFRPPVDLQANTSYRWSVRAALRSGEFVRVSSQGSFVITDPPLPTTTLLYQNFPNPFPSAAAFATCFWFDVGAPGATISLDITDLRGTVVRSLIPGPDGVSRFDPGRYGRGVAGAQSNCDNRFVWDGTATDGRTVAPGVYLARFRSSDGAVNIRRIVFLGR
jgi:hypothetical protein